MFVLRQLNNKIVTNFVSMSMISFLLFLSIATSLSMFTYKSNLEQALVGNSDFDASGLLSVYDAEDRKKDIRELLDSNHSGIRLDDSIEVGTFFKNRMDLTLEQMLSGHVSPKQLDRIRHHYSDLPSNIGGNLTAIRNTEYNNILRMKGLPGVELKDDEVLLVSNYDVDHVLSDFLKNTDSVEIDGKTYRFQNTELVSQNLATGDVLIYCYLIVPDNFSGQLEQREQMVSFLCTGSEEQRALSHQKIVALLEYYRSDRSYAESHWINGSTSEEFQAKVMSGGAGFIFTGIYLGIIFLIASVAVLSIQQLSDASDSIERYRALQKIGATDNMICKAIFRQILVYFTLPLLLAIVDSVVGIQVIGQKFNPFAFSVFGSFSLFGILVFLFVFAGYLMATYNGYKNVIFRKSDKT